MMTVEEAAKEDIDAAVDIVARWYRMTPALFRRHFKIRWYNTEHGRREYRRLKGVHPEVVQESGCYGWVEDISGTSFVFIHESVWQSGRDMVATAIHELLHVVEPSFSEEQVSDRETMICEAEGLDRSWILDD